MKTPVLYIKNMVCQRCIKVVKEVLSTLRVPYRQIALGEVVLAHPLTRDQLTNLSLELQKEGFQLLADKNARTVEKIKNIIIDYVHQPSQRAKAAHLTFSNFLSEQIGQDYSRLSQLFSAVEGITIEKYLIHQKIERVKELIKYDELNLTQIADFTGYSSVQYLSNQFKRVTGLSPKDFKKLNLPRHGIDSY